MLMNMTQIAQKLFIHDHWRIGIIKKHGDDMVSSVRTNISDALWIPEEEGHYYADPFIIEKDNLLYIFFEDYHYESNQGSLAYIIYDGEKFSAKQMILNAPFHQSYPYLFSHNDEQYCLPEQAADGMLTLYKAVCFPDVWAKEKILINEPCVDASILFFENKWWIFTTMSGETVNTNLYIYYADDLLGTWKAHSANPVRSDVSSARPAGNFFMNNGALHRPAQNCKNTYGGDIMINKITQLTPESFTEKTIANIGLLADNTFGTHTLSASEHYIAFDVKQKASSNEVIAKYRAYTHSLKRQYINS